MSEVCHDVEALYRAGASIKEIMRLTGLRRSTVEYRLCIKQPARRKMRRACMCCGTEFMSDGPHNRLCTNCRRISVTNEELYWCDPPENRGSGCQ